MLHRFLFYNAASSDVNEMERGLKRSTEDKKWYKRYIIKYFQNTIYRYCFTAPWIAPALKKDFFICNPQYGCHLPQYVNAFNTWVYLAEHVLNGKEYNFIQRCMYMFIDDHMANIYKLSISARINIIENNNQKDRLLLQPYITQIIMQILPPSRNNKNNLNQVIHLLQKSQPQRCQIRNLKSIVVTYIEESTHTFEFLLTIIKFSLLGLYPHCKCRLNFQGRDIIFDTFINQLSHKGFFIKWFRNSPTETQIFLFYCLKEFLVHAVRISAKVWDVVDEKYKWNKFDKQVSEFMDLIRSTLSNVAKREYNFVNRSNWMVIIEPLLQNVSKNHTKLFRTTPQLSFYGKTALSIQKFFISKNKYDTTEIITSKMPKILWCLMQRLYVKEDLLYLLTSFNIDKGIIQKLHDKTFTDKDFKDCDIYTLECIYETCKVFDRRMTSGTFVLPKHLYDMQVKALKKKNEDNVLDTKAGLNFLCTSCNDIKIFLMKKTPSSRHSNKLAKGSLRVVVSNEEDKLRWVCGKRAERHTKNTKRRFKKNNEDDDEKVIMQNNRKIAKEKIRDVTSRRCINTDLLEVDLLGQSLFFNSNLMLLCSNCANATVIDNNCFTHFEYLNCQNCLQERKTICIKCNAKETTCTEVLTFDSTRCQFCISYFCTTCNNTHAAKQPVKI